MNAELPGNPREELELKITALLLGELSETEAATVRAAIAEDADLQKLHDDLKQTIHLVREATVSAGEPQPEQGEPLKLAEGRRKALQVAFTIPPLKPEHQADSRRAVTRLIEVLAVVAILAVMAALLLPSLAKSKQRAQSVVLQSNMRQLELAKKLWAEDHAAPPGTAPTMEDLSPYLGGQDSLRPAIGERYRPGKVGEPVQAEIDAKDAPRSLRLPPAVQADGDSDGKAVLELNDGRLAYAPESRFKLALNPMLKSGNRTTTVNTEPESRRSYVVRDDATAGHLAQTAATMDTIEARFAGGNQGGDSHQYSYFEGAVPSVPGQKDRTVNSKTADGLAVVGYVNRSVPSTEVPASTPAQIVLPSTGDSERENEIRDESLQVTAGTRYGQAQADYLAPKTSKPASGNFPGTSVDRSGLAGAGAPASPGANQSDLSTLGSIDKSTGLSVPSESGTELYAGLEATTRRKLEEQATAQVKLKSAGADAQGAQRFYRNELPSTGAGSGFGGGGQGGNWSFNGVPPADSTSSLGDAYVTTAWASASGARPEDRLDFGKESAGREAWFGLTGDHTAQLKDIPETSAEAPLMGAGLRRGSGRDALSATVETKKLAERVDRASAQAQGVSSLGERSQPTPGFDWALGEGQKISTLGRELSQSGKPVSAQPELAPTTAPTSRTSAINSTNGIALGFQSGEPVDLPQLTYDDPGAFVPQAQSGRSGGGIPITAKLPTPSFRVNADESTRGGVAVMDADQGIAKGATIAGIAGSSPILPPSPEQQTKTYVYSVQRTDPAAVQNALEKLFESQAEADRRLSQARPAAPSQDSERGRLIVTTGTLERDTPLPRKPGTNAPIPQPEMLTSANNFSTFSLNVSDVSFKLAAASLEQGQLPDAASIRSEEFINAFDYRDPEAPPGSPIAFAWERARYPFAHNRDLLRFSLKTAAAGRQAGRPLNVVLLLDNSGSMERADRVQIIREALRVLASQLQPQDRLSVITFARTPHLVADGISGDQAGQVTDQVAGLTPQGGTNLEDAMRLAYETAVRHYLANGINRVVVLTDGAANLGDVEPESLKQTVEANRRQGIALDCFGIGWEGFNDDLLEVLSRNGDGRYGFINTPTEAATDFAGQLAGALKVAASDVKVQVEFNPARVTAYRQIGYARHQLTKEQFRDNTVDAAEIAAQEAGNALYTVEVNPDGTGPLCTVRVRYKVPGTLEYREQAWAVPYSGTAVALDQASAAMRLAATASAFSEWLAVNPYAGEVTPNALLGCLSGVPEAFGADPRPKKLEWMIRQAMSIAGQ